MAADDPAYVFIVTHGGEGLISRYRFGKILLVYGDKRPVIVCVEIPFDFHDIILAGKAMEMWKTEAQ